MDFVAPFVIIGAAWGLIRRFVFHPTRLQGQRTWESLLILITVLLHPITHINKMPRRLRAGWRRPGRAWPIRR